MTDNKKAKISVIGLGEAGKNVANLLREYKNYQVYTVDSEGDPDYLIPEEPGPEEYEKDYSDLELYDEIDTEEVIFILSGPGDISGASGPLLMPLRDNQFDVRPELDKNVTIYYIEPDREFLSQREWKKERVARNALMQMSRSAVFERMFFFSNPKMVDIMGGVPVVEYYDRINELIAYTVHSYFYYRNNEPVFGSIDEPDEINRLSTMGIIEDDDEKYFYDLDFVTEKEFYFNFSREELNNNLTLVDELKEVMKEKREGEMQVSISYGIYESARNESRHICAASTHVDQSLELEKQE